MLKPAPAWSTASTVIDLPDPGYVSFQHVPHCVFCLVSLGSDTRGEGGEKSSDQKSGDVVPGEVRGGESRWGEGLWVLEKIFRTISCERDRVEAVGGGGRCGNGNKYGDVGFWRGEHREKIGNSR